MVAKVFGTLQGQEILFSFTAGEWVFDAPRLDSGEYVMDIWAEDEAGNQAYMATMLFAVDTNRLCVNVRTVNRRVWAIDSGFTAVAKMTRYSTSVVRCELCGRW